MKYLGLVIILFVVAAGAIFSSQSTIEVVNEDVYEDNHLHIISDGKLLSHKSNHHSEDPNALPENLQASSLKGTRIDGAYPVDEDGNLVVALSIKQRFEYFLSTIGEYSLETILTFIDQDMINNLQEPALSQARELLSQYIAFKQELSVLESSFSAAENYEIGDLARFKMQLDQMKDVRRQFFSAEASDAFFGFDEIYDDFMLNQLEIQNNDHLTALEKQEQISALQQNLPEEIRESREQTQKISDVYMLTESLKKEGASQEEIQAVRQQAHGIEAAERLQALDSERARWQQRVDTYLAQKSAIELDDSLTESDKQSAISNLKEGFSSQEQMRLRAFELMAQER